MNIDNRKTRVCIPTDDPHLEMVVTDDGSRTLRCLRSNVTWHSESGALAESQLVFIENSGLQKRLESGPCAVLEIGFGTGMNFWLAATIGLAGSQSLEYVSLEPSLLSGALLRQLEHDKLVPCELGFERFGHELLSHDAQPQIYSAKIDSVSFELHKQQAEQGLDQIEGLFDIVFHDPFGPDDAPELWSETMFGQLHARLNSDGCLVTYCVKSSVQKALKSSGFQIQKTRGPVGGKREVLIAFNR